MPAGSLDVNVLGAYGLRNTQTFGKQDPYFIVQLGKQHFVSETHTDGGKNPQWNQKFTFQVTDEKVLYITIKNKNVITTDDVLGKAEVHLDTVFSAGKHDCRSQVVAPDGKVKGELSIILLFNGAQKKADKGAKAPAGIPQANPGVPGGYPVGSTYGPGAPIYGAPAAALPGGAYPAQSQPAGYSAGGGYPLSGIPAEGGYPPAASTYPPVGGSYPPAATAAPPGYPGSSLYGAPAGYPNMGPGPGYPPASIPPQQGYPPMTGPPQQGYPPMAGPPYQGYHPGSAPGNPGYPQGGAPSQPGHQGGSGYPPQGGYGAPSPGLPPAGYPVAAGTAAAGHAAYSGQPGKPGKHGKYKPPKHSGLGVGLAGGAAAGLGAMYVAHQIGKGFGKMGKGFGKFGKFGFGFGKFGKF